MSDSDIAPLRGIFHVAAVMPFCSVMKENEENLSHALAAKTIGALNLHRITLNMKLEVSQVLNTIQMFFDVINAFVLISSIASLIGERTSAAYGASNGALDSIARYRTLMGLPALVVNFGQISLLLCSFHEIC